MHVEDTTQKSARNPDLPAILQKLAVVTALI